LFQFGKAATIYRCRLAPLTRAGSLNTTQEKFEMATDPEIEEPGFEHDVNERPHGQDKGSEYTLEDTHDEADEMEQTQKDAAEERKEGGYQ
jgi:hypothetical protein